MFLCIQPKSRLSFEQLKIQIGPDRRAFAVSRYISGETPMTISVAHIQPIVALIAGVLILIAPRLLNYIVAFYLIITGIVGMGFLHG